MNLYKLAGVAGALVALTACVGGDKICDSGDSGCEAETGDDSGTSSCGSYTGSTYLGVDTSLCDNPGGVEPVLWDCDAVSYYYDVFTVGWTGGADLLTYQTGSTNGWDENHPITSYAFSDDGWWDNLYAELEIVGTTGEVVDGSTTLYQCNEDRKDSLTFQLVIYDTNNTQVDCAVWGHDPGFPDGNCTDISSWF